MGRPDDREWITAYCAAMSALLHGDDEVWAARHALCPWGRQIDWVTQYIADNAAEYATRDFAHYGRESHGHG